jgi:hypothetical protein
MELPEAKDTICRRRGCFHTQAEHDHTPTNRHSVHRCFANPLIRNAGLNTYRTNLWP